MSEPANRNDGGQPMETANEMRVRVVEKAAADDGFRAQLMADPKAALRDALGVSIPESFSVEMHEEGADVAHLVIPPSSGLSECGITTGEGRRDGRHWSNLARAGLVSHSRNPFNRPPECRVGRGEGGRSAPACCGSPIRPLPERPARCARARLASLFPIGIPDGLSRRGGGIGAIAHLGRAETSCRTGSRFRSRAAPIGVRALRWRARSIPAR